MAQDVVYKLVIDASGAHAGFEAIKQEAGSVGDIKPKIDFTNLSTLQAQLAQLKTVSANAFDFSTAKAAQTEIDGVEKKIASLNSSLGTVEQGSHGFFSTFKEGFGAIANISIGTALGEGLKDMFSGFIDKAREAHTASLDLAAGISRTGLTGDAATAEMDRLGKKAEEMANEFALPKLQMTELQAKVAGFSGQTGAQLDKLVEISIGAANALQLPAESVAKLIARSGDPEQAATLTRLGIVFDKNASTAEKMQIIQEKFGPAIDATKAAAASAVGDFDRLKNTVEEAAIGFASNSFEALQPVFNALIPVVTTLGEGLVAFASAIGSVASFAAEHKTIILSLVGAYVAFRAVSAISEAGGLGAIWTKANAGALEFLQNLLGKVIPGLGVQVAAEEAVTVAEGEAAAGAEAVGAASTLALGPIGILIGLAAVAGGAFLLFGNHTKDTKTAIEDVDKALTSFNEANKHAQEVEVTAQKTAKLSAEYDKLKGQVSLTKDESSQLSTVTKELNDATGGAAAQFDNYGNLIGVATDKVKALSAEQVGLANQLKNTAKEALDAQLAGLGASLQKSTDDFKKSNKDVQEGSVGFFDGIKAAVANVVGGGEAVGKSLKETQQNMQIETGKAATANLQAISGTANTLLQLEKSTGQIINNVKDVQTALKGGVDQGVAAQVLDQIQKLRNAAAADAAKPDTTATDATESEFKRRLKIIQTLTTTLATELTAREIEMNRAAQEAVKAGTRATAALDEKEQQQLADIRKANATKALDKLQEFFATEQQDPKKGILTKLKVDDGPDTRQENLNTINGIINKANTDINKAPPKVKVIIDLEKIKEDLISAADKLQLKEIEVGVRPKEDILSVIDDEIGRVQSKVDAANKKLALLITAGANEEEILKAQTEIDNLTTELNGKQKEYSDHVISLNNVLRDAQIGLIDDDVTREKAALAAKLADVEAYYNRRIELGGQLTDREILLRELAEEKYQKDVQKLDDKGTEDKIKNAKEWLASAVSTFAQAFQSGKALSDADYQDKKLGFEKQQSALASQLQKGEISYKEYQVQLAKLNQDRNSLEENQNANAGATFTHGLKNLYAAGIDALKNYVLNFIEQKAAEAFITVTTEEAKTGATTAGVAARVISLGLEKIALGATAIAQGVAAAAAAAYNAIIALPFPADLIAGAASVAAVVALFGGLTGLIKIPGFESGGILINENTNRPEIIAPYKEFTEFASQLIIASVQTTAEAMQKNGSNSGGGGRTRLDVFGGKITSKGRDVAQQLEFESVARKSEVAGPPQTVTV